MGIETILTKICHILPKIGQKMSLYAKISQNETKLSLNLAKIIQNQIRLAVLRFFFGAEYWTGEERGGGRKFNILQKYSPAVTIQRSILNIKQDFGCKGGN